MGVTRIQTAHGIRFRARITIDGQRHNLGMHRTQHEAAEAINSFLERCGIPYEETAAHQRQKERAARQERQSVVNGTMYVVNGVDPIARIDLTKKSLLARILAKLKR